MILLECGSSRVHDLIASVPIADNRDDPRLPSCGGDVVGVVSLDRPIRVLRPNRFPNPRALLSPLLGTVYEDQ